MSGPHPGTGVWRGSLATIPQHKSQSYSELLMPVCVWNRTSKSALMERNKDQDHTGLDLLSEHTSWVALLVPAGPKHWKGLRYCGGSHSNLRRGPVCSGIKVLWSLQPLLILLSKTIKRSKIYDKKTHLLYQISPICPCKCISTPFHMLCLDW